MYTEGIAKLSANCARESERQKVGRYIEFSSGCMYSSDKQPVKEDCNYEPWTFVAEHKADVERFLNSLKDLKYTIIRLPIVYGKSDRRGLGK